MEREEQINALRDGFRHLRVRDADELAKYGVSTDQVPRPGFNQTGKEIEVALNAYPIAKFPSRTVYQYDVSKRQPWFSWFIVMCASWCINIEHRSTLVMAPKRLRSSRKSGTPMLVKVPFVRSFSTVKSSPGTYCNTSSVFGKGH